MAEQAQALKAEAPVGMDVCLVSKGYALCDGLQARARTKPRKSSIKSLLLFPVPNHAQIQSIPGLVGDLQCYFLSH